MTHLRRYAPTQVLTSSGWIYEMRSVSDGRYVSYDDHLTALASLSHTMGVKGLETDGLIKFAKEMLDCAWQGGDADGGFIQDFAEECGLIRREKFDPEKHVDSEGYAEEGQDWFVYDGPLERIRSALTPTQQPVGWDKVAREAHDELLNMYRTWIADDKTAHPNPESRFAKLLAALNAEVSK